MIIPIDFGVSRIKNNITWKYFVKKVKQEMSLKKTNGVGLKKRKKVLVHKSYTDDRKLRMIIVKDQWTAILANFLKK